MGDRLILANQATAAKRRVFFQVWSVIAAPGTMPSDSEAGGQPQISTNGGAWTDTGIGTLTLIGSGRYYADLTQTAVATAGDLIQTRYDDASTHESVGDSVHVVACDLDDALALGLSRLDVAVSSVAGASAAAVADAVWDEARSGHVASGSFGQGVASVQGAVTGSVDSVTGAVGTVAGQTLANLDAAISSRAAAATALSSADWTPTRAGKLDYLDAAVSSRSTYAGGAVASVTGDVGGNVVGSVASVAGAVGSVTGNVGGSVLGSVTGAVGAVTGNVGGSVASVVGNVGGNVVGSVASVVGAVGSVAGLTPGNLDTTVSSRAAAATALTNATWTDGRAAKLDNCDAPISGVGVAPSAATVADAVWNEEQSGHVSAGTFGKYVDATVSSRVPSTGAGAGTLTVTVTVSAVPLAGVALTLRDSASGTYLGAGTTNASGQVVMPHSGGVLQVIGLRAGYTFGVVTTANLGASDVATASMTGTATTLTPSGTPGLCSVQGTLRNPAGTLQSGVNGSIKLKTTPQDYAGNLIKGDRVDATSNSSGVIAWEVPQGAVCLVSIPGYVPETEITIPASGAVDLSTLL